MDTSDVNNCILVKECVVKNCFTNGRSKGRSRGGASMALIKISASAQKSV